MAALNQRTQPAAGPQEGQLVAPSGAVSAFVAPEKPDDGRMAQQTFAGLAQFSDTLSGVADRVNQREVKAQQVKQEGEAEGYLTKTSFEEVGKAIASGDINAMGGPHYRALILARHGENLALRRQVEIMRDYTEKSDQDPNYDPSAFMKQLQDQDVGTFGDNPIITAAYNEGLKNFDVKLAQKVNETQLTDLAKQNADAAQTAITNSVTAALTSGKPPEEAVAAAQQAVLDNGHLFGIHNDDVHKMVAATAAGYVDKGDRATVQGLLSVKDKDGRTLAETMPEWAAQATKGVTTKWRSDQVLAFSKEADGVMASIVTNSSGLVLGGIDDPIKRLKAIEAKYAAQDPDWTPHFDAEAEAKVRRTYGETAESRARQIESQTRADINWQQGQADRAALVQERQMRLNRITMMTDNAVGAYIDNDEDRKQIGDSVSSEALGLLNQGKFTADYVNRRMTGNLNSTNVGALKNAWQTAMMTPATKDGANGAGGAINVVKMYSVIKNANPLLAAAIAGDMKPAMDMAEEALLQGGATPEDRARGVFSVMQRYQQGQKPDASFNKKDPAYGTFTMAKQSYARNGSVGGDAAADFEGKVGAYMAMSNDQVTAVKKAQDAMARDWTLMSSGGVMKYVRRIDIPDAKKMREAQDLAAAKAGTSSITVDNPFETKPKSVSSSFSANLWAPANSPSFNQAPATTKSVKKFITPGQGPASIPRQNPSMTIEMLKSVFPQARITSSFRSQKAQDELRRKGYTNARNTYHGSGHGLDLEPMKGISFTKFVGTLAERYTVLEALDESKSGGTGPHWHVAIAPKHA